MSGRGQPSISFTGDAGIGSLPSHLTLRTQARALEQANLRNERLLHGSRELIERWLLYLRQVLSGYLYTADGRVDPATNARSLDRSA